MKYTTGELVRNNIENAHATVLLAHGAGADLASEYLEKVVDKLNAHNFNVIRFNFPYMIMRQQDGKRRPPDRMPKLLDAMEQVVDLVASEQSLFILGKSMGSRVAVTLCENESIPVKGVACIGYPFHPQKKPEKLRLEPLQKTTKPVLILQGERDALGNKQEVLGYPISEHCSVSFFADGDHDLKPRVKSGYTLEEHLSRAIEQFVEFVDEHK